MEYESITAELLQSDVVLDWSTLSEINNDRFEIERSYDLVNFEYLGYVEGNGTSLSRHEYSFVDKTVTSGTVYYRLKFERFSLISPVRKAQRFFFCYFLPFLVNGREKNCTHKVPLSNR